ncbi:MAG: HupE/UreJ family protein [Rhizobiales bacterium]|nr:HupE/UreJ family protein [Hyphomicrobiales bacterium]
MTRRPLYAALILAAMTAAAEAHTGTGGIAGFTHGLGHPFSGFDHILAMVAVGFFAANLGGRALWLVPCSFVAMMAVGGAAGMHDIGLLYVEIGIALSVIVLGAAVAFQWKAPAAVAMALAGFFAIFHGHAHGSELPAAASGAGYALGFILATASLHAFGIASGRLSRMGSRRIAQMGGGAMTLAGVGILTGIM